MRRYLLACPNAREGEQHTATVVRAHTRHHAAAFNARACLTCEAPLRVAREVEAVRRAA